MPECSGAQKSDGWVADLSGWKWKIVSPDLARDLVPAATGFTPSLTQLATSEN
jgi:hypothetical protein